MAGNLKFSSSVVNIDQRTGLGTLHKDRIGLLASLEWTVVGSLAILVVLGLALRLNQLGAIGFAEDEMNKLDAVRSYEAGDFSPNAHRNAGQDGHLLDAVLPRCFVLTCCHCLESS